MERNFVPDSWVGQRVMIVPFDEGGASLPEQRGWLVDVADEGIGFAQEFWDDSVGKLLPEKARVYPWDTLALVTLLRSGHLADEGLGGGGGEGSQEEPSQQRS